MEKAAPPSPAPSDDMFQKGFQQLQQHNASTPYPPEQLKMEASEPHSRFGTPLPQSMNSGFDPAMAYTQVGYMPYQQFYPGESPYGPLPDDFHSHQQQSQPYNTPATSPPTPSQGSDANTTRSGLSAPRTPSVLKSISAKTSRVEKPAPKKKKERVKAPKKVAKLERPLSELTKDWTHIPVVDIDGYVNRSSEVRRQEVEQGKVPGKIKRPMNAFMLYRKAYQNRTKDWCLHNNHQVVSQVCGDSWPLEPEHIRDQFTEWARLERANHQKAHPGYKFTPSKPKKQQFIKKSEVVHHSDEGSDLDEFDWAGRLTKSRSRTRTPLADPDAEYQPPRSIYQQYPSLGMHHRMGMPMTNRSAFHVSNPGKPLPTPYDQANLANGQYYQQMTHTRPLQHTSVEDVLLRKTPSPSMSYQPQMDNSFDLLGQYPPPPPPQLMEQPQAFEQRLDPSLLGPDGGLYDGGYNGFSVGDNSGFANQQSWQSQTPAPMGDGVEPWQFGGEPFPPYDDGALLQNQHTQLLRGTEDSWQIEPLESEQFNDSWMDPVDGLD